MDNQARAGRHWIWICFLGIVILAIPGYMGYSIYTQTGLGGYLMALQIGIFGAASFKMTLLIGMLILGAVATPVLALVHKLLAPIIGPGAGDAALRVAAALNTAPRDGYSWKVVAIVTIAPLVIGAAGAGVLFLMEQREQAQTAFDLDLADSQATLPAGASLVEIKGLVRAKYLAGYKEQIVVGDYEVHLYAPITGPKWTTADPVQYILHRSVKRSSSSFDSDGRDRDPLPDSFTKQGLVVSPGKLAGDALPVIVQKKFKSDGLVIAPSMRIVDWMEFSDRHAAPSEYYWGALAAGVGVSVVAFMIMLIVKLGELFERKRKKRQMAGIPS